MEREAAIAITAGVVLVIIGVVMMRSHVNAWRSQKDDPETDDLDRQHYHRRYRRRMQTSGMIAVLGVLLGLYPLIPQDEPWFFTTYVVVLLALALWVIMLAMGDMASTSAHSRIALGRIERKRRELERELAEYRSRSSNGRHLED